MAVKRFESYATKSCPMRNDFDEGDMEGDGSERFDDGHEILGFSILPGTRMWSTEQDGQIRHIKVVSLVDLAGEDQDRQDDCRTIDPRILTETEPAYDPSEKSTYYL